MALYQNLVERCFTSCCNDFTSKALSSKEARLSPPPPPCSPLLVPCPDPSTATGVLRQHVRRQVPQALGAVRRPPSLSSRTPDPTDPTLPVSRFLAASVSASASRYAHSGSRGRVRGATLRAASCPASDRLVFEPTLTSLPALPLPAAAERRDDGASPSLSPRPCTSLTYRSLDRPAPSSAAEPPTLPPPTAQPRPCTLPPSPRRRLRTHPTAPSLLHNPLLPARNARSVTDTTLATGVGPMHRGSARAEVRRGEARCGGRAGRAGGRSP